MWNPYIFLEKWTKVNISFLTSIFCRKMWNLPLFFGLQSDTHFFLVTEAEALQMKSTAGGWILSG